MRTPFYIATTSILLALVQCDNETDNGACEQAREVVISAEESVCFPDSGGANGYKDSKFCARCVAAGYYSTTGASVCQCTNLTFNADFCSYQTGDDAVSAVRAAIDWADQNCADFTPPTAILPALEAGTAAETSATGDGGLSGGDATTDASNGD